MKRQYLKELDYAREADNLRRGCGAAAHRKPVHVPNEKLELAIRKRLRQIYSALRCNRDPYFEAAADASADVSLDDMRQELLRQRQQFTSLRGSHVRWLLGLRRAQARSSTRWRDFQPLDGAALLAAVRLGRRPCAARGQRLGDPLRFVETTRTGQHPARVRRQTRAHRLVQAPAPQRDL